VCLRRPLVFIVVSTCWETCFSSCRYLTSFFFSSPSSFLDHHTGHPARHDARILLMSASSMPSDFFIIVSIYWKPASYRSSLDLLSFGKATNRSVAKLTCSFFVTTCTLFDMSIALRLRHDLSKVAAPTPRSGACETGYPWVPTDQAHGRPRQVGPAYQKTHRPIGGPNRPSWRPTRPPKDLPEDSLDDLVQTRR
jgi:hypothetical protein